MVFQFLIYLVLQDIQLPTLTVILVMLEFKLPVLGKAPLMLPLYRPLTKLPFNNKRHSK
jgi:hypothetical protein